MNETNLTKYANGFTITVNKEAGEMLIAFTQNQPIYDANERDFKAAPAREVCSIVLPYGIGIQLGTIIEEAQRTVENPNQAEGQN
ncbi:unknown [Firmicutes bacterium CAG:238]|nr:unknown [Firmicutes bacterium CAG:238]